MSPRTKPEQAKLSFVLNLGYVSLQKNYFVQNLSARSKAVFRIFKMHQIMSGATISSYYVHTDIHV